MIRVRGGSGFGDSIYVRAIAEHYLRKGETVVALTDYPDVFRGSGAEIQGFTRNGANIIAHYTQLNAKSSITTTQWQDVCRCAGVPAAPLRFDWTIQNEALISRIKAKAAGRPIIVVHGGRVPMDRKDGFGMELLPEKAAFDVALEALRDCYTVQVGKADKIYPLTVDLDMTGETTVADLMDIAYACAGIVAQCSFAIPLAEVFDKPLLAIWGARAAQSKTLFIRQTTPTKVLSGPRDRYVMDDWTAEQITKEARAFRFV